MKLWEVYSALGDPVRLKVFLRLVRSQRDGKVQGESVGDLCQMLGVTMVNLSHHLGVLRNAGVLESTKHGRHIYYTLGTDFEVTPDGVVCHAHMDAVEMYLKVR